MSKMALANILSALCVVALTVTPIAVAKNKPQDFVDAHSAIRATVGANPLIWDDILANYAKNYIRSKINTCEMVHSNTHYGENLASANGRMSAATAVNAWADEKKFYDYNSNTCVGGECRHYTQLVWKKSIFVGCASVKCKNNSTLISCNYSPSGNIVGELPY